MAELQGYAISVHHINGGLLVEGFRSLLGNTFLCHHTRQKLYLGAAVDERWSPSCPPQ